MKNITPNWSQKGISRKMHQRKFIVGNGLVEPLRFAHFVKLGMEIWDYILKIDSHMLVAIWSIMFVDEA